MRDSKSSQPRAAVRINGTVVGGFLDWDVNNNNFYEADTFRVTFPVAALPPEFAVDSLISAEELIVEILAGFPGDASNFTPSELYSLILGLVDDMDYDPTRNVVTLSGRDYTSKLIDAKTTEKWPNKTASEIATILAQKHGLKPVVTNTTKPVGTFYEIDHVHVDDARSEWDLITWLANKTVNADGTKFVVYVKGTELHFEPGPKDTDQPYELEVVQPNGQQGFVSFDGMSVQLRRNLTVLKNVVVTVKSWNSKQAKMFTATYPSNKARGINAGDSAIKKQNYERSIPGLTYEQCLQRAQAIHSDITKHEVRLLASMPADNDLSPQRVVKLKGTGTVFDQLYYPESVQRRFSSGGYTMELSAKNHSTESNPTI